MKKILLSIMAVTCLSLAGCETNISNNSSPMSDVSTPSDSSLAESSSTSSDSSLSDSSSNQEESSSVSESSSTSSDSSLSESSSLVENPTKSDEEIQAAFNEKILNFKLTKKGINDAIGEKVNSVSSAMSNIDLTKLEIPNVCSTVNIKKADVDAPITSDYYLFKDESKIYFSNVNDANELSFIDLVEIQSLIDQFKDSFVGADLNYVDLIMSTIIGDDYEPETIDSFLSLITFKEEEFIYQGDGVFTFTIDSLSSKLTSFGLNEDFLSTIGINSFELNITFDGYAFTGIGLDFDADFTNILTLDDNIDNETNVNAKMDFSFDIHYTYDNTGITGLYSSLDIDADFTNAFVGNANYDFVFNASGLKFDATIAGTPYTNNVPYLVEESIELVINENGIKCKAKVYETINIDSSNHFDITIDATIEYDVNSSVLTLDTEFKFVSYSDPKESFEHHIQILINNEGLTATWNEKEVIKLSFDEENQSIELLINYKEIINMLKDFDPDMSNENIEEIQIIISIVDEIPSNVKDATQNANNVLENIIGSEE